jgi:hypothetical protein
MRGFFVFWVVPYAKLGFFNRLPIEHYLAHKGEAP